MDPKFTVPGKIVAFLPHDAMQAWYMPLYRHYFWIYPVYRVKIWHFWVNPLFSKILSSPRTCTKLWIMAIAVFGLLTDFSPNVPNGV